MGEEGKLDITNDKEIEAATGVARAKVGEEGKLDITNDKEIEAATGVVGESGRGR